MASTMFESTYAAYQEITKTFDIIWALDAGLWNLRTGAQKFYLEHPNATESQAKNELINGLQIHGINLRRIANELTWEYEEQYISELLLTYGIGIFDSWVDNFVDTVLTNVSNKKRDTIKADLKKGEFQSFDNALAAQPASTLIGCFHITANRQDAYIDNLRLIYKYFKSCRNCCAHGNHAFTKVAEDNYNLIKNLKKEDCGIKEVPKIVETIKGMPVKLILRGVVGFFDVLIRIIKHYDIVASDKIAVDEELKKRWATIPYQPIPVEVQKRITQARYEKKRNYSIRFHLKSVHMYAPYVNKTDDVYLFLSNNSLIV